MIHCTIIFTGVDETNINVFLTDIVEKALRTLNESSCLGTNYILSIVGEGTGSEKGLLLVTSVPKKRIPSAVVYYYCAWYSFFWNERYLCSTFMLT